MVDVSGATVQHGIRQQPSGSLTGATISSGSRSLKGNTQLTGLADAASGRFHCIHCDKEFARGYPLLLYPVHNRVVLLTCD